MITQAFEVPFDLNEDQDIDAHQSENPKSYPIASKKRREHVFCEWITVSCFSRLTCEKENKYKNTEQSQTHSRIYVSEMSILVSMGNKAGTACISSSTIHD